MSLSLTTLANAKAWLGVVQATDDVLIQRLVESSSDFVVQWLNKPVYVAAYSEKRDGSGSDAMALRNWPVTGVTSVLVAGIAAAVSNGTSAGYVFDDKFVYLIGSVFPRGRQNVIINYTAGYGNYAQTAVIPASNRVAPTVTWIADLGVTINGVAAVLVASTPITGQYALPVTWDVATTYAVGDTVIYGGITYVSTAALNIGNIPSAPASISWAVASANVYTFAAADIGKAAVLTYLSPPMDIEQACLDLIGLKYRERNRIGLVSQSIQGETTSYFQKDLPDNTKALLQNYRKVLPL